MLLFEFLNLFSFNQSFAHVFSQYDDDGYPVDDDSWEDDEDEDDDDDDDDFYSDDYEDED